VPLGGEVTGLTGVRVFGNPQNPPYQKGETAANILGYVDPETIVEHGAERFAVKEGTHELEHQGERDTARATDHAASPVHPDFAGTSGEQLPIYGGGKTEGVLDVGGQGTYLKSGYQGPSADIPRGTPGFNGNIKAHVEGHAAAVMRQQKIEHADLFINQRPCGGVRGCDALLPRMLPKGGTLVVHGPDGFVKTYHGLPDH